MFGHNSLLLLFLFQLFACFSLLSVSVDCPFVSSSAAIFHGNATPNPNGLPTIDTLSKQSWTHFAN